MPYYYVYSPTTGYSTSCPPPQQKYCAADPPECPTTCSCWHPSVLCSNPPIDVATGGVVKRLDFWGSQNIRSIVTTRKYGIVCAGDIGSPWDDGVEIKMYAQAGGGGSYIGKVFFAHADDMINNGTYNTILHSSGDRRYYNGIAWIAPNTCGCGCYQGAHVHLERCAGTNSITNPYIYCGTDCLGGQTWVFRWGNA